MLAPNQPDEKQSCTYHLCNEDETGQWLACRDHSQLIDKVKDHQRVEDWK